MSRADSEKLDLDKHFFRRLNPHQPFQKTFVRVHIDQPLVNPHLPAIPSVRALATRALASWDPQSLGWERNRAAKFHTRAFGDLHNLAAYAVQALRVSARQPNSRFIRQDVPSALGVKQPTRPVGLLKRVRTARKGFAER